MPACGILLPGPGTEPGSPGLQAGILTTGSPGKFCMNIFKACHTCFRGFPGGSVSKESICNAGDTGDAGSIPGSGRFPWRRAWQPTPVILPGESHGQRGLAGNSQQGQKESDTAEATERTGSLQGFKLLLESTGPAYGQPIFTEPCYVLGLF